MRPEQVAEAIAIIGECRTIHVEWVNVEDEFYNEKQTNAECGGGRDWHRKWVEKYDRVLCVLKGFQKMQTDLRKALEARGLRMEANEQEAQDFYAALSLEEKGRIGVELSQAAYEDRLTVREDPPKDLTCRVFALRADSLNEQERSVEAVIATDTPTAVYDWRNGRVIEEVLRMDGAELPEQVPLLDNHYRYSLDDVFGSVRRMTTADHDATGRLFFAEGDERIDRAFNKVKQRHLRDVSAGYRVLEFTDIPPGESRVVGGRTYTARGQTLRVTTRWELKEVSLVPIGADSRSKIRGHLPMKELGTMNEKLRKYLESIGLRADATEQEAWAFLASLQGDQRAEANRLNNETQRTEPPVAPPANPPSPPAEHGRNTPPASDPASDPAELARQAVAAERDRVRQITEVAGADVPAELRQQAINEGWDLNRTNAAFLQAVRAARVPNGQPYHQTAPTQPVGNQNIRSMAAGLMLATGISDPTRYAMHTGRRDPLPSDRLTAQDAEQGHRLARLSAIDFFRECVLLDTGRRCLDISDAFEAARSAPSGGTLAYVFTTSVYAKLIAGWDEVEDTTDWCDTEDVANFLTQEDISLEANARLRQLARGGTAVDATVADTRETYKIARYARKWGVDEQDIIDDRLSAIMRMPQEMGMAARRLRPDLVYALLLANAALADTGALFNSTAVTTAGGHANLTTAVLGATGMKASILAMAKYRLADGTALNIKPRYLIVPQALKFTALEILTSTAQAYTAAAAAATPSQYYPVNVLQGEGLALRVDDRVGAAGVVDPTTNTARTGLDTNWFLSAGGPRTVRVAYRRGTNRQPVLRSFTLDKGQWGMGWDINMDIGAKALDYRGLHKSTGAG